MLHGIKGCFDTVKIEIEELEIQKKRRVLGKTFHFSVISSYLCIFHLYPAGCLNLRWMSLSRSQPLKPGNWCQLAHVHLPSPQALQNDRRFAGLWRLCVAQQSRDEGILQGIPILRGGLDAIKLGLLLSTWETSHGWWFTSKYLKTLRFQFQRYRCPERRKMGFSLASGVLQRSDLHWPWSAPKKRLMGIGAQRIAWKDCNVPMAYWNFASANCSNGDIRGVQLVIY